MEKTKSQRQTNHVSIEVNQVSSAASPEPGVVQLSSSNYRDDREGPISTIILGDQTSASVQSTAPAEEASKLKRKCVQCCWPMSISTFFVALGRLFTGFNLTVDLPKYCTNPSGSNSQVDSGGGSSIPFENLQEEASPFPPPAAAAPEQTCAPPVEGNAAETSHHQSTCNPSPEIRVKFQLPFFIILITVSQWVFFHFVMKNKYDGWYSSNLEFNPLKRYEIWRFFTATWIHGSVVHLRGNLRLQLLTGLPLEVVHGWKRVGILYFGGVIFANLTTSVIEPFLRAYGASGGVYALLTGHLASNIMNWKEKWGASNRCLLICIYLGLSIFSAVSNKNVGQHILPAHHFVGHAAHFGGALAGLLIGFFVLKNFRKNMWEIKAAKICQNVVIVLFILAVGANIGDQISVEKGLQIYRQKLLQTHNQTSAIHYYSNFTRMLLPELHSKSTPSINSL